MHVDYNKVYAWNGVEIFKNVQTFHSICLNFLSSLQMKNSIEYVIRLPHLHVPLSFNHIEFSKLSFPHTGACFIFFFHTTNNSGMEKNYETSACVPPHFWRCSSFHQYNSNSPPPPPPPHHTHTHTHTLCHW